MFLFVAEKKVGVVGTLFGIGQVFAHTGGLIELKNIGNSGVE